ncbi:hypothetical protein B296_00013914 [Ensete ventricosum]|uniref:Uncharacterized protein n=1 Tax=Ensete ventricosum TaxID=4639 RepID=A0A426Z8U8_ENSVE|nr:hypothetical protein B296_00013914 [Ensete ventricosum]
MEAVAGLMLGDAWNDMTTSTNDEAETSHQRLPAYVSSTKEATYEKERCAEKLFRKPDSWVSLMMEAVMTSKSAPRWMQEETGG